jgi:hypothetical protein
MQHSSSTGNPDIRASILQHIHDPSMLERLYRVDSHVFIKAFSEIYPEVKDQVIAQVWHERLNHRSAPPVNSLRHEWIFILIATLFAGMLMKLPQVFNLSDENFYPRNIAFAVFPMLSAFIIWRTRMPLTKIILPLFVTLISAIYINLLPRDGTRDTVLLACIHLPLLLWALHGFVFTLGDRHAFSARINYLRYNGDLLVMTALITIAAVIFSMITFGLFNMIGMDIEKIWEQYIIVWGAPAVPILANVLVRENPTLVNRISPLIAKIFTPLVLVMLAIFLGTMIFTGKNPYQDRDFLLIFNALLIGVMALIIFSVSEASKGGYSKLRLILLLALSIFTIINNGIALSAISFRLLEFGLTPNRLAVLGGNLLIMTHLLMVTRRLFLVIRKGDVVDGVEKAIAAFLPVYAVWTMVVVFGFPLFFGFR